MFDGDIILDPLSRVDRDIQWATEMLPLKRGTGCCVHKLSFNCTLRVCRYASCWRTCFWFSLQYIKGETIVIYRRYRYCRYRRIGALDIVFFRYMYRYVDVVSTTNEISEIQILLYFFQLTLKWQTIVWMKLSISDSLVIWQLNVNLIYET